MKILVLQVDVLEDKEIQKERVREKLLKYSGEVELAVLPELWTTGYRLKPFSERAETDVAFLERIANELEAYFLAGSIFYSDGAYFNRSFLISPKGEVIGFYDKLSLFKPLGEHRVFQRGKDVGIFSLDSFKIGVAICYDLRFPEIFRKMALSGALLTIVPAQWPLVRIEHWKALLKARAIENQMFILGVNRYGREEDILFGGNSMLISPKGEEILNLGKGEAEALVEVDLEEAEVYRKEFPVLEDIPKLD